MLTPAEPEQPEQPVCFNNCSGHGRCVDYACQCDPGYDGDDCSFCESVARIRELFFPAKYAELVLCRACVCCMSRKTGTSNGLSRAGFFDGDQDILPILSVGDVNVTSSNFRDTLNGAKTLLVVATSRSCHRCIHLETEYQSASSELKEAGVRLCPKPSTAVV